MCAARTGVAALWMVVLGAGSAWGGPPLVHVTWTGGAGNTSWTDPQNWSPPVVPINSSTERYAVTIPGSRTVAFSGLGGEAVIDSLVLGSASTLDIGRSLRVRGEAFLTGNVATIGTGASFTVDAPGSRLIAPGFLRTGGSGSEIVFGASHYSSAMFQQTAQIFRADASNSRLVCQNMVALDAGFNDNNPAQFAVHSMYVSANAALEMPALETIRGALAVRDVLQIVTEPNAQLRLPALRSITEGHTQWQLNAPLTLAQAETIQFADIQLDAGATLAAPLLINIDNTRMSASGGARFTSVAPAYSSRMLPLEPGNPGSTVDIFRAFGARSVLDLSSIQSIDARATGGPFEPAGQVIRSSSGGRIDLTGLRTITGATASNRNLAIYLTGPGDVNMPNLEESTGNVIYEVWSDSAYGFDRLHTARDARFLARPGVTLQTPVLADMDGASVNLESGGAYTSVAQAYSSRAAILPVSFSAGGNAHMNLDSFASIDARFDDGTPGVTHHVFSAIGGSVSLRGVSSLRGPVREEDSLRFYAQNGDIHFGSLTLPEHAQLYFTVGGAMEFNGSLHVSADGIIASDSGASPLGSRLSVGENLTYANTVQHQIQLGSIELAFHGATEHLLEVGGRNVGNFRPFPDAPNFSVGLLRIGDVGVTSTVRLVDLYDNSLGTGSEALYLYHFSDSVPTSLRLFHDSELIIGAAPVYAKINGAMTDLHSLIPGDADRVRFDEGWIVIPAPGAAAVLVAGAYLAGRRRRA